MNTENKRGKSQLKILRERAEKTQGEIALEVGVSDRNVRDWENKGAIPSLDKAVLLARSLGVPLKQLCKAFGIDVSEVPDDVKTQDVDFN